MINRLQRQQRRRDVIDFSLPLTNDQIQTFLWRTSGQPVSRDRFPSDEIAFFNQKPMMGPSLIVRHCEKKQMQLTLAAMEIESQLTFQGVDLQLKLAGL